jgi:hypothetical protein
MTTTLVLIIATGGLCALYLLAIAFRAYRQWRGPMVVTCPETQRPAAVAVDAGHAALTAMADATELRLTQCSRWPERQGCGQECLRQIELAPEDCLVRSILARWYAGSACTLCGVEIPAIHSWDNKPGMIGMDGKVVGCTAIPGDQLPGVLATYKPVCWNCLVAEEFRGRNPELVIDWPVDAENRRQHVKLG